MLAGCHRRRLAGGLTTHPPKAKRVIYLFMSGGPSQHDMWDYKPKMQEMFGEQLPEHVRDGQRITGMTASQKKACPLAPSKYKFTKHDNNDRGRLGQRTAAAHRHGGQGPVRRPQHLHRGDQSRPGDHLHPDRQPDSRAGRASAPGSATGSAA